MGIRKFSNEAEAIRNAYASLEIGAIFDSKLLARLAFGFPISKKDKKRVSSFICHRRSRNEIAKIDKTFSHCKKSELPVYKHMPLRKIPKEFKFFKVYWNQINHNTWFTCDQFRNLLLKQKASYADSKMLRKFLWHLKDKGLCYVETDPNNAAHNLYKYKRKVMPVDLLVFVKLYAKKVGYLNVAKVQIKQPIKQAIKQPIKQTIKKEVVTMEKTSKKVNANHMTEKQFVDAFINVKLILETKVESMSNIILEQRAKLENLQNNLNSESDFIEKLNGEVKELKEGMFNLQENHKKHIKSLEEKINALENMGIRKVEEVEQKDRMIKKLQDAVLKTDTRLNFGSFVSKDGSVYQPKA